MTNNAYMPNENFLYYRRGAEAQRKYFSAAKMRKI